MGNFYKKKPVIIYAHQWHTLGDHPEVERFHNYMTSEYCTSCQRRDTKHGRIKTLEGWHIVCPGDWIITGIKGEFYPVKDEIFKMTYELTAPPKS